MPSNRYKIWLAAQCQILTGVDNAVLIQMVGNAPRVLATWPREFPVAEPVQAIVEQEIVQQVISKRRLQLTQIDESHYRLANPLIIDGECWGLIALDVEVPTKKALTGVLHSLKLGQFWLQFLLHQQTDSPAERVPPEALAIADYQLAALQLGLALLKENSLPEVAISLVNGIASHVGAARVGLGLVDKKTLGLQAISFSASFDPRTEAMQAVTEAMRESLDQGLMLSTATEAAGEASSTITRAHQQLMQLQQLQWVGSFPIRRGESLLGVLTIELDKQPLLNHNQQMFLQVVLHFAGAIIGLQQEAGASITQLLTRRAGQRIQRWFGGSIRGMRAAAVVVAVVFMALFIPRDYSVTADASLQTTEKYRVVSPQDGYLGEVRVRPGDKVTQTTLLASLKDDDLRLERAKLSSQVQRFRQAYDSALANSNRVDAAIADAQMEQAAIQLRLLEQQLQRTQLVAPIDGIIVSDDISQMQGAPVKQGDVLFELAAANNFIVQVFVDERDIAALLPGQLAQVKLSSLPSQLLTARVKLVTPISEVREGRNYFRVELTLGSGSATDGADLQPLLRPGMTGSAKIIVGKRALGWIWFHDLWHWLRISLWW
jgi:biotin carboxyl carrier protein